ncbi:MAG: DUF559 domain-containing protein, partial [Alphaproteobacteria bacterium]|nr:DUF559 domain-containing protein [Alphaproteobacteria bacterium]
MRNRNRLDRLMRRRALRRALTPAEAALWRLLRKRALDGRRFRRQFSVGAHVLDFFCPRESLAIEMDGAAHDHDAAAMRDGARDEALAALGIRTLRFENRLVFEAPDALIAAIRAAFMDDGRGTGDACPLRRAPAARATSPNRAAARPGEEPGGPSPLPSRPRGSAATGRAMVLEARREAAACIAPADARRLRRAMTGTNGVA